MLNKWRIFSELAEKKLLEMWLESLENLKSLTTYKIKTNLMKIEKPLPYADSLLIWITFNNLNTYLFLENQLKYRQFLSKVWMTAI